MSNLDTTVEAPVSAKKPPPKPAPTAEPETAQAAEQAKCRFVDVQAVYSPTQGVIRYGDAFMVSAEQLEQDQRFIAWSENWTPDPALMAASELEG